MKYIDLFAGIGGFHSAMIKIMPESKCIAAVEFDKEAADVYQLSYGITPLGDITNEETIKKLDGIIEKNNQLDILFAGFPCQTFSKAGKQEGFNDQTRGTLFFSIKEILKVHKPKYFILENVRNLLSHKSNEKKSFEIIKEELTKLNYNFEYSVLSPHRLKESIPQMRERVFIYGIYDSSKNNDKKMEKIKKNIERKFNKKTSLLPSKKNFNKYLINEDKVGEEFRVESDRLNVLEVWETFLKHFKSNDIKLISPIWTDVFYDKALQKSEHDWKQKIIDRNVEFYENNKVFIDEWYKTNNVSNFIPSNRKFEWNANNSIKSIFEGIIQFRPSGVRIKKPDFFPTFVAINHKPIIGWEKRYITPEEVSKLYGFEQTKLSNQSKNSSYKQLGNTVSVDIAEIVIDELLKGE